MNYFRDDSTMTFLCGVATGLGLGALAMFILDPGQGRRRRALARDKMVHYGRRAGDLVSETAKDLRETVGLEKPEPTKLPF